MKKIAAAIGGFVLAGSTLACPVYGVPCNQKQVNGESNGCLGACDTLLVDGGDPTKDSTSSCFVDGGTP